MLNCNGGVVISMGTLGVKEGIPQKLFDLSNQILIFTMEINYHFGGSISTETLGFLG